MGRFAELKRLDKKTRNKLRAILSIAEGNAIPGLADLRGALGKDQSSALDVILNSRTPLKAVRTSTPFPKNPPFVDTLQPARVIGLDEMLSVIEVGVVSHKERLARLAAQLHAIDQLYAERNQEACLDGIIAAIQSEGWSHALLRRVVLVRENQPKGTVDERVETLVRQAGIKNVPVASLIHAYSLDQNILTIKRSILNIADRGTINRYTRAISRLSVQPFAASVQDLAQFLSEVERCSLIDAVILAKFNAHLFELGDYPALSEIATALARLSSSSPWSLPTSLTTSRANTPCSSTPPRGWSTTRSAGIASSSTTTTTHRGTRRRSCRRYWPSSCAPGSGKLRRTT